MPLDNNEPDQALSPLRRALIASGGTPSQPVIALTTAAAYLLSNNPRAANRTLVEYRTQVRQPDFLAMATFLDTLARFRMCTDKRQKQRETNDLLTCLLTLDDSHSLGSPGLLLVAQAHQEVGMVEPLIPFATKAIPRIRGPLSHEMVAILADACLATGRRQQATKLYMDLASGRNRHAASARFRLAEISHSERNAKECLKWCQLVRKDDNLDNKKAVLRLMANAYEWSGENEKAILCLNGTPP